MVHRQIKIRQENDNSVINSSNSDVYSPYQYPKFSRYNYPSKMGGDEDIYTEEKFTFPHWDDEVSPYSAPIKSRLRRHASSPAICGDDMDGFFNGSNVTNGQKDIISTPSSPSSSILSSFTSSPSSSAASLAGDDDDDDQMFDINKYHKRIQELKNQQLHYDDDDDENEVDESQLKCVKIQSDINLAREDQKSDYGQVGKEYSSLHDDIRYLQREIEEFESNCLNGNYKLNNADDNFGYQSEPTSVVTGSLMAAVSSDDNGSGSGGNGGNGNNKKSGPRHIISTPSAAAAGRSFFKNRNNRHHYHHYYDDDDEDDFISNNNNSNR